MNKHSQREQLLQLRSELVGILHTHPGSVYTDRTIEDLLEAQPKSIEELTKVKGFPAGGKRVRAFGTLVVEIFNPSAKGTDSGNSRTMNAFNPAQGTTECTQGPSQKKIKTLAVVSLAGCISLYGVVGMSQAYTQEGSAAAINNLEKYRYMQDSKQEAKENWESGQREIFAKKMSKEAAEERAAAKAVAEAKVRKERLKAHTVTAVKKNVKQAQKESMKIAKDAERYCKKLEKLAAAKRRKAAAQAKTFVNTKSDGYDMALEDYVSFSVGNEGNSEWKSWMSYLNDTNTDSIFNKESPQYRLQQEAYTGDWGIRMVDGRYCVAVASHYASVIGTKIDVVLDSGKIIKCVLGDQKADADTDSLNRYHLSDGSYVEFIVSTALMDKEARRLGNYNCIDEFRGFVTEIRIQR